MKKSNVGKKKNVTYRLIVMSIITAGIITRPGSGGKNSRQEMVSIPTHDYLYANKPTFPKTHPHSKEWQFTNFPEVTFTNLAMICVTELRVTGRNAKCAHYFWVQHLDSRFLFYNFLISLAWNYITKVWYMYCNHLSNRATLICDSSRKKLNRSDDSSVNA